MVHTISGKTHEDERFRDWLLGEFDEFLYDEPIEIYEDFDDVYNKFFKCLWSEVSLGYVAECHTNFIINIGLRHLQINGMKPKTNYSATELVRRALMEVCRRKLFWKEFKTAFWGYREVMDAIAD